MFWDFRYSEAKRWFQYAIDILKAIRGGSAVSNDVAIVVTNLAIVCKEMGQLQEAAKLYEDALNMRRQLFKGQSPYVAQVRHVLLDWYTFGSTCIQSVLYLCF